MRCEDISAHVADHLAGTLEPSLAEDVAAHLRDCAACVHHVESLDETWQILGAPVGEQPDSAAMRARFAATLEGYRAGSAARPAAAGQYVHTMAPRAVRWRAYGVPVAAAAAVLIIGVAVGRQTVRSSPADPQIGELRAELRDMRQMVTLSLLQQPSASERLKGVAWTGDLQQPNNEVVQALLDTLMHDPNVNVRLATIDALRRLAASETVRRGAIDALPQQTAALVQLALIDFLAEINGREAVDALRRVMMDSTLNDAVRARAQSHLRQIG